MPAFQDYHLSEGDVDTDIDITCKDDDGSIINVTSATPITFHWKHDGLAVVTKSGGVQDGVNGVVRYTTLAADIKGANLTIEVTLTIAGKGPWTSDPMLFRVKPKLV